MAEDRIATLYNLSELMTKAGASVKEKHEEDFKKIISYVKTSKETKERILAAQLIARFFKYFPEHQDFAFDSIVDLCESVDVDVRKHATITMIAVCRDCKSHVPKAADILIQLYQTNQASEVNLINQSLTTLLNLDISKFLHSFFTNFEDGNEVVRERALKFLSNKIHTVPESAMTKEVEEQLLTHSKKAMEDVTKDEFIAFVSILTKLKIAKTAVGQAMIVLVIKAQAELDKEFKVEDRDTLDKFLLCTKHTIPLLSQYNRASEYLSYICLKILPQLSSLSADGSDLRVLQTLAEMSPFIHADDIPKLMDLDKCLRIVYDKLLEYLPHPPEPELSSVPQHEGAPVKPSGDTINGAGTDVSVASKQSADTNSGDAPAAGGASADQDQSKKEAAVSSAVGAAATPAVATLKAPKTQDTDFQFTHIEYLMFTFHQFCRLKGDFFTESLQNEIKLRLQHLALGCSKYMEILSSQLKSVRKNEDLRKEENKLKSVALRTTKNISLLVRDLLRKPPQFKTTVPLSCKISPEPAAASKRLMSSNNNTYYTSPPKRAHN